MSGPARPAESEPGRRTEFRADSQPRPLSRRASVLVLSQALAGRAAGRSRRSRDASHFKFAFGFGSVSTAQAPRTPACPPAGGLTVLKTLASGKDPGRLGPVPNPGLAAEAKVFAASAAHLSRVLTVLPAGRLGSRHSRTSRKLLDSAAVP